MAPPGPKSKAIIAKDREYVSNAYDRLFQFTMKRASGSAIMDADGNVYIAWYIDYANHDQVEVYPPMSSWVNHQASRLTNFDPGSYVCEGMCVSGDGLVIWATNRSNFVKRF